MTREQLEHIIRAAASIADDDELIIVGSQAVLGQYPNAPAELLVSIEADVYPKHHPDRADLIDGAIGEGSDFHETFGYYAQGVGPTTAVLPTGWDLRLVSCVRPRHPRCDRLVPRDPRLGVVEARRRTREGPPLRARCIPPWVGSKGRARRTLVDDGDRPRRS